jgi:hypothetical protein
VSDAIGIAGVAATGGGAKRWISTAVITLATRLNPMWLLIAGGALGGLL